MKEAYLDYSKADRAFYLADAKTQERVAKVEVGGSPGEVDWDLVEAQANSLGYTLYVEAEGVAQTGTE